MYVIEPIKHFLITLTLFVVDSTLRCNPTRMQTIFIDLNIERPNAYLHIFISHVIGAGIFNNTIHFKARNKKQMYLDTLFYFYYCRLHRDS